MARSRLRRSGAQRFEKISRPLIIKTHPGVRLLCYHSARRPLDCRGTVVIIHGWLGSAQSTYVVQLGRTLFRRRLDVYRLNLRDHGRSAHLNRGLFYATRLAEVEEAIAQIVDRAQSKPIYLVGFSLGGNFVLRLARKDSSLNSGVIRRAVAISPVLDPAQATDCIDRLPLFRHYFLHKWRRALRTKKRAFPDSYHFADILAQRSVYDMTVSLLDRLRPLVSVEQYFNGYTISVTSLARPAFPVSILTAADDPIIPADQFHHFANHSAIELIIQPWGGHNGFLTGLRCAWHEKWLAQSLPV
jgi:predicted alpha/beta-fold hydrolase